MYFSNIDKINAIKEFTRRYHNTEISTQVAECFINEVIFYVDLMLSEIPASDSVYDVTTCYIRLIPNTVFWLMYNTNRK